MATASNDGEGARALLVAGTAKGLFIFSSDGKRADWEVSGPHFAGQSVYAAAYDGRAGRTRLWVAASSMHWGAVLCSTDDFGRNWSVPESYSIRFPVRSGKTLQQIWQIMPAGEHSPDKLYCGVEPAALFVSEDAGRSWKLDKGLFDHPHRKQWMPGGGGLCLHTILPDPADPLRVTIAISTGGVYRTDDGGRTWRPRNSGVRAQFLPEPQRYPEFGQCVHKVVSHPAAPQRLFLQNHFGLYRSDDGGDSWRDIADGTPSDFGFAMEVSPSDPETVYIVPLDSDQRRWCADRRLRVYRTKDGGTSWQPLSEGLPQGDSYETVLRDGLAADDLSPHGVYFGTRSGKLYGSADAGDSWRLIADNLPPVLCVKAYAAGPSS
jgi:photosystem II stability/assembly factor-like uncharacterized protein